VVRAGIYPRLFGFAATPGVARDAEYIVDTVAARMHGA
jgi:hypothetical protein